MTGDAGPKSEYTYAGAGPSCAHDYLIEPVLRALHAASGARRVLDAGCGNGAVSGRLEAAGFEVSGFDSSTSGIEQASRAWPRCRFRVASVYDDLLQIFGAPSDTVVSLEEGAGRVPLLWKSMILFAERPVSDPTSSRP